MRPNTSTVGKVGEDIASKYLKNKGFSVRESNFLKKWGEIDIVAQKKGGIYFIEVKSVSCENIDRISPENRPEENVHGHKLKRLSRAIQSYLLEHKVSPETPWQLDVIVVFIEFRSKRARVRSIENVPVG